jgi:hypothetical protein
MISNVDAIYQDSPWVHLQPPCGCGKASIVYIYEMPTHVQENNHYELEFLDRRCGFAIAVLHPRLSRGRRGSRIFLFFIHNQRIP